MNSMQASGALAVAPTSVDGISAEGRVAPSAMPGSDTFIPADQSAYVEVAVQTAMEGALFVTPAVAKDVASTALLHHAEAANGEDREPVDAGLDLDAWPQLPSFSSVWQPERTSVSGQWSASERSPAAEAQSAALVTLVPSSGASPLPGMGDVVPHTSGGAGAPLLVRQSIDANVEGVGRQGVPMPEITAGHALATPATADAASAAGGASMASAVAPTATAARGAQPLVQALSQRILLQQAQGVDVVTVRLDPPQFGTVEVRIQHDPAGVQVILQASHAEVGRQLAGMAEGLRQELQARSSGEATVVVAQSRQSHASAGQGGQSRENPGLWAEADEDEIGQALLAWLPAA